MDNDKFKDVQGRWRAGSLFWEQGYDRDHAIYTLRESDHPDGYPSFSRLWIEIGDPEGYRQANELLGGWNHYKALLTSKWFSEYMEGVMEELEVKIRSEAILTMEMLKDKGGNGAMPAAKFLAEGKYKPARGRGRPSKAEVEIEARKQAAINSRVRDDMERLGLTVVEGNED